MRKFFIFGQYFMIDSTANLGNLVACIPLWTAWMKWSSRELLQNISGGVILAMVDRRHMVEIHVTSTMHVCSRYVLELKPLDLTATTSSIISKRVCTLCRSMEKWGECKRSFYIFGEKFSPFFRTDVYSPKAFNTYIFCGPVSSGLWGRLFSPKACINSVQSLTIVGFTLTVHAW